MEMNPDASIVEMDTVYNDGSNGPFLQTFKFLNYDFLFCVYHQQKTSENMLEGILYLETILGEALFNEEVMVLKTDRGSRVCFSGFCRNQERWNPKNKTLLLRSDGQLAKGSLKMFIYSSGRFVLSRLIIRSRLGFARKGESHLIPYQFYNKKKLNNKTSFSVLPSSIVRWLIDSLAMD